MPHTSDEAGERPSRTPWSEGGCRVVDGELEPRRGHRASPACHRETTQSCEGQRFHSVTNRMPLRRARPDLWEPQGVIPGATRPAKPHFLLFVSMSAKSAEVLRRGNRDWQPRTTG